MISLKENRTEFMNLHVTITALEELDCLIDYYSADKLGPAYCTFTYVDGPGEVRVQFNRKIVLTALNAQRAALVEYLASLGISVE